MPVTQFYGLYIILHRNVNSEILHVQLLKKIKLCEFIILQYAVEMYFTYIEVEGVLRGEVSICILCIVNNS